MNRISALIKEVPQSSRQLCHVSTQWVDGHLCINQDAGHHEIPILLAPWSWIRSLQTCEKEMFVVYEPPALWSFPHSGPHGLKTPCQYSTVVWGRVAQLTSVGKLWDMPLFSPCKTWAQRKRHAWERRHAKGHLEQTLKLEDWEEMSCSDKKKKWRRICGGGKKKRRKKGKHVQEDANAHL